MTRVRLMLCALWMTFVPFVKATLSLDLTPFGSSWIELSRSAFSTVVLSDVPSVASSTRSHDVYDPSFSFRPSVHSSEASLFSTASNHLPSTASFIFESINPSSFSFASPDPPDLQVFTFQVDMTIQNESVDTFSLNKQTNLRNAFAVLLKVTSESVRIQSMTNIGASTVVFVYATTTGINVLLAIDVDETSDVTEYMRAVETMFVDGSLAAYLDQLGTPMQLELNEIWVHNPPGEEHQGDDNTRSEAGSETGSEAGSTTGEEKDERIKKSASPAVVIVATTSAFGGVFGLIVCAKQRRIRAPGLNRMFTRIVPDMSERAK